MERAKNVAEALHEARRVLGLVPNEDDLRLFLQHEPGWAEKTLWLYGGERGAARLSVVPGLYLAQAETPRGKQQHHQHGTTGIMTAVQWVRKVVGEPK